jgi:fucose permease
VNKRFLVTAHAVFAMIGVANTMLGPLLPLLAQRWQLGDRQAGALFLTQFVGGFSGAILSTRLARSFSLHRIARAGLLLLAAGFVGFASPLYSVAILGAAINGVGLGLSTPSITAAMSEAFPERRASLLNLLNFAWALGAITAPNLVLLALRQTRFNVQSMLLAYAATLVAAAFVIPRIDVSSHPEDAPATPTSRTTLHVIFACGLLIFLYVGVENGVAGWLPTFATRIQSFDVNYTAYLQDTFWSAFLLGRLAAPVILKFTGERLLLTLSICIAVAGTCGLLLLTGAGLFLAAALVGVGCAAIMPTAIAILSQRLAGQSGSKLGFMFACAGLGAAVVPYAIGALSSATRNLRFGMWLLVVVEILLLASNFVMAHLLAKRDPENQAVPPQVLVTGV